MAALRFVCECCVHISLIEKKMLVNVKVTLFQIVQQFVQLLLCFATTFKHLVHLHFYHISSLKQQSTFHLPNTVQTAKTVSFSVTDNNQYICQPFPCILSYGHWSTSYVWCVGDSVCFAFAGISMGVRPSPERSLCELMRSQCSWSF